MKIENWSKKVLLVLLSISLFSCSVLLIGAYNQNVDENIQTISKDISTLFVQTESNVNEGKDYSYSALRDSYIKIEGEIQSCIVTVSSLPKYNIVLAQMKLLSNAEIALKNDHMSGFVAPAITDKKEIIKAIEIDKSGFTIALTAMIRLQEGLKRVKTTSK